MTGGPCLFVNHVLFVQTRFLLLPSTISSIYSLEHLTQLKQTRRSTLFVLFLLSFHRCHHSSTTRATNHTPSAKTSMDSLDFGYLGNDKTRVSTTSQGDWDSLVFFQHEVGSQWLSTSIETFSGSGSSSAPSVTGPGATFSFPSFKTYDEAFSYPTENCGFNAETGLATPHRSPSPYSDTHIDPTLRHSVAYPSHPYNNFATPHYSLAAEPFFATFSDAVAPVASSSTIADTRSPEYNYPSPPLTDQERGSAVERTERSTDVRGNLALSGKQTDLWHYTFTECSSCLAAAHVLMSSGVWDYVSTVWHTVRHLFFLMIELV